MNKFNFEEVEQRLEKMKSDLPVILANQAQKFFVASWKKQGWDNESVEPWKIPKRKIEGTKEWKYPKSKGLSRRTNPILVGTGKLRRDINNSIRMATFNKIKLQSSLPYSGFVNNGTPKMEARKFMGDSYSLRKKQVETINNEIIKAWQE